MESHGRYGEHCSPASPPSPRSKWCLLNAGWLYGNMWMPHTNTVTNNRLMLIWILFLFLFFLRSCKGSQWNQPHPASRSCYIIWKNFICLALQVLACKPMMAERLFEWVQYELRGESEHLCPFWAGQLLDLKKICWMSTISTIQTFKLSMISFFKGIFKGKGCHRIFFSYFSQIFYFYHFGPPSNKKNSLVKLLTTHVPTKAIT